MRGKRAERACILEGGRRASEAAIGSSETSRCWEMGAGALSAALAGLESRLSCFRSGVASFSLDLVGNGAGGGR